MNLFIAKQRKSTRARSVLWLFAVVWLNMALPPCAMALAEVEKHNCPHCPEAMAHDQHGSDAPEHDTNEPMPCSAAASQCDSSGDFAFVKISKPKFDDTQDNAPILVVPAVLESTVRAATAVAELDVYLYLRGSPPPLNVLYCVYLD